MRPARERQTLEHPAMVLNGVPFESVVSILQNHPKMPLWLSNDLNHRDRIRLVSHRIIMDAIMDFICLDDTCDRVDEWSNWYYKNGVDVLAVEYCEKWLTMVRP